MSRPRPTRKATDTAAWRCVRDESLADVVDMHRMSDFDANPFAPPTDHESAVASDPLNRIVPVIVATLITGIGLIVPAWFAGWMLVVVFGPHETKRP